jgi:hypothetical protein
MLYTMHHVMYQVWSEKTKYEQIPDPDAEVKEGETPPTKTVSKTTYEWVSCAVLLTRLILSTT